MCRRNYRSRNTCNRTCCSSDRVHSTDVVGLSANLARDTFRCVTRQIVVVTCSISWGYNDLTSFSVLVRDRVCVCWIKRS